MADIAGQVGQLKDAADRATEARHRADAAVEAVSARLEETQQELRTEFDVENLAEARAKEKRMETALEAEAARVTGLLQQAGGRA
jgi:hypothetical protein